MVNWLIFFGLSGVKSNPLHWKLPAFAECPAKHACCPLLPEQTWANHRWRGICLWMVWLKIFPSPQLHENSVFLWRYSWDAIRIWWKVVFQWPLFGRVFGGWGGGSSAWTAILDWDTIGWTWNVGSMPKFLGSLGLPLAFDIIHVYGKLQKDRKLGNVEIWSKHHLQHPENTSLSFAGVAKVQTCFLQKACLILGVQLDIGYVGDPWRYGISL